MRRVSSPLNLGGRGNFRFSAPERNSQPGTRALSRHPALQRQPGRSLGSREPRNLRSQGSEVWTEDPAAGRTRARRWLSGAPQRRRLSPRPWKSSGERRQPLRCVPEATAGHAGGSRAPWVSEKQRSLDCRGVPSLTGAWRAFQRYHAGTPFDPSTTVAPSQAGPWTLESRISRPLRAASAPRRAWASSRLRAQHRSLRGPARWPQPHRDGAIRGSAGAEAPVGERGGRTADGATALQAREPSSDVVPARGSRVARAAGLKGPGSVGALSTHRSRGKGRERLGPQEAQGGGVAGWGSSSGARQDRGGAEN